jgi:hypothetical protein
MLRKVVSCGQTGADQAGWRAAKLCGLETGGWMTRKFLTEGGTRPEFAQQYGAVEHPEAAYLARLKANVRDSDATLVLTNRDLGRKTILTIREARRLGRPCTHVSPDYPNAARYIAGWLVEHKVVTLNVAGNQESTMPGVGVWAEGLLVEAFGLAIGVRPGVRESVD